MPVSFTDKDGLFTLPTGWHEVSTRQFCAVDPLTTVEQRASYFAGRPIQVNGLVADALKWMLQAPPTSACQPFPDDLGQETYLQVETIRDALSKHRPHECYAWVYGVFRARTGRFMRTQEYDQGYAEVLASRCPDMPLWETYPAFSHCLAELQRLATKYAELSAPDPTEAGKRARDAGADELLGIFGHFNVAKAIAQQMGITLDAAYNLPWETVALYLLHERRTAIVSDTIQRNSKHHE